MIPRGRPAAAQQVNTESRGGASRGRAAETAPSDQPARGQSHDAGRRGIPGFAHGWIVLSRGASTPRWDAAVWALGFSASARTRAMPAQCRSGPLPLAWPATSVTSAAAFRNGAGKYQGQRLRERRARPPMHHRTDPLLDLSHPVTGPGVGPRAPDVALPSTQAPVLAAATFFVRLRPGGRCAESTFVPLFMP